MAQYKVEFFYLGDLVDTLVYTRTPFSETLAGDIRTVITNSVGARASKGYSANISANVYRLLINPSISNIGGLYSIAIHLVDSGPSKVVPTSNIVTGLGFIVGPRKRVFTNHTLKKLKELTGDHALLVQGRNGIVSTLDILKKNKACRECTDGGWCTPDCSMTRADVISTLQYSGDPSVPMNWTIISTPATAYFQGVAPSESQECSCDHGEERCLECGNRIYSIELEGGFCLTCQYNTIVNCTQCNRNLPVRDARLASDNAGYYCITCYDNSFRLCRVCGDSIAVGADPLNGNCQKCNAEVIKEWNAKPNPVFKKVEGESVLSDNLYFGTEIEIEMKPRFEEFVSLVAKRAQADLGDDAYFKKDSSISHGFELVTHPGTFEWWMDPSNNVLKVIRKLGKTCESFWPQTTGQHVHVSRAAFDDSMHIAKFLNFFDQNKLFTSFVAERHNEEYAYFDEYFSREYAYSQIQNRYKSRHHAAVTTFPDHTIEVRVFKGNLRRARILKNIQFVAAVWLFTKDNTGKYYEKMTGLVTPIMTCQQFIEFVKGKKELFPDLEAFIRNYKKEE